MEFDAIRKKLIANVQAALPGHLERLTWNREQLAAFQLERLRKLLKIAQSQSAWYQRNLSHIDPDTFTLAQIKDLPVLTKSQVMENWDELVTIPGLTRKMAEEHLEQLRKGKKNNPYFQLDFGQNCRPTPALNTSSIMEHLI